jgi:hypothetical protein
MEVQDHLAGECFRGQSSLLPYSKGQNREVVGWGGFLRGKFRSVIDGSSFL